MTSPENYPDTPAEAGPAPAPNTQVDRPTYPPAPATVEGRADAGPGPSTAPTGPADAPGPSAAPTDAADAPGPAGPAAFTAGGSGSAVPAAPAWAAAEPAAEAQPEHAEPPASAPGSAEATAEPATEATAEPATGATAEPPTAEPITEPATEPTAADRPTDEPAAADQEPSGSRLATLLPVVGLALITVLVLLTGFLAWQVREGSRTDTARTEALEAARDAARLLFSYDHNRLEQDFEAALAVTTGSFREDYERTTREVVQPVAEQYDAVVDAAVVEASVVSAEPERVVVVAFVNQTTTSTRVEGPKIDQSRVRMVVRDVDGTWLVQEVKAL